MNQRRHVTLVAAASTLLATAPLATVYQTWTWSVDVLLAVAAICCAALGTRALRAPIWAQFLAMLGALLIMATWLFGAGAIAGTVPTPTTLRHFGNLLTSAGHDISDYGVPVPDREGLLFLTTVSVGLVAILVDLVAVGLRRPALAGFPMLAMYWIPVLVHPDSVSPIPFAVAAAGFLWLLVTDNVDRVRRFGRRFTGEGRDVDVWEPSPLAAAGRRLAVVGVLLAVVLPLVVPGMTNGLLNRFGSGGGDGSLPGIGGRGGGPTINLFSTLAGSLNQDHQLDMVKLTTNDPSPYYLRIGTADKVTAAGFGQATPVAGQLATGLLPDPVLNIRGVTQRPYTASVTIQNLNMSLLPIYTQPQKIQKLDSGWFYDHVTGQLYSSRENSSGRTYTFDFLHTDFDPTALNTAKPLPATDEIQQQDTQVPEIDYVTNLVNQLTQGKTTVYEKVLALYDYFSTANKFTYALSTKSGTSGDDIVDFLTNKQGYCEQYASALAWLVRAAHIPARVAFGFTRGGNRDKETYTLTNYNLHAWTEVYFANFGWVPFDATPVANIAGAVSPTWAPDINHKDGTVPGGTGTGSQGTEAGATSPGQDPTHGEGNTGGGGLAVRHQRNTWPYWAIGGGALVLLLIAMPAVRRTALRRRRRPKAAHLQPSTIADVEATEVPGQMLVLDVTGSANAARWDAHSAWDELVDTMVDYRIPLDEAETPRVTAERVASMLRLRPEAADGVRRLGQAEERARYARVPLAPGGLAAALRTVRTAIAGRSTRWVRIRAVLLPPSVIRRWATATADGVTGVTTTVGRWRDAALRAAMPRRLLLGRPGRGNSTA